MQTTSQAEHGVIKSVALKHPREAFGNQQSVDTQWKNLNYTQPPDFAKAVDEYDEFVSILEYGDCAMTFLPHSDCVGLDSIYTRDSTIATDKGVVLCKMGKPSRNKEPSKAGEALSVVGTTILGSITGGGRIEGGDVAWIDQNTIAVGRGYRTNDEGIRQFEMLLGEEANVITVPLPHEKGPDDVFHLMSIFSPIGPHTAVVFSPLMPVPFREELLRREFNLVEVPVEEYETMGCNVLAISPDRVIALSENPITRGRIEAAGFEVLVYRGEHISHRGCGGPTCLTRPLKRSIAN